MTEPDDNKPIRPNTVAWAIVQILADGHRRTGSDIRWRLECAGIGFGSPECVRGEIGRLCRRGVLDRTEPMAGNSRQFWLRPGGTLEIGESL